MGRKRCNDAKVRATEHEGMLLSLIARTQPVTGYQLYKLYEQSPVSSINASKGQLYPAIRRLKTRGLVSARKVAGDGRNVEELSVTRAGIDALREWTKRIDSSHVVLDDPLRTRLFTIDLLTREERLEWIASAKALIKQRQQLVDEFDRSVDVPYQEFAHRSAVDALRVKMEWLDDLLYSIAASNPR